MSPAAGSVPVYVEVTNTLTVPYVTGLQRLTRELLSRLPRAGDDAAVHAVPIRWCAECGAYLTLDGSEAERLARSPGGGGPAPSRRGRLVERLPGPVADRARRLARTPVADRALTAARAARQRRKHPVDHEARRVGRWQEGAIFFDLEAGWHDPVDRTGLLAELSGAGVTSGALIADVMPELFPQWFDEEATRRFDRFVRAHLAHSAHLASISRCTERDLASFATSIGIDRPFGSSIVPMGADFAGSDVAASATSGGRTAAVPAELAGRRFLLCVSTIEPRKNQALLVEAHRRLAVRHPDLAVVLVGKEGWKVEELVAGLRRSRAAGDPVFWLGQVDDATLGALYRDAFLAVTPSFYEGFGNPVVEALAHGTPTLASSGGALPEAGGDLAEYFDPQSVEELVALIERHLDDPVHHAEVRARVAGYRPPTWEDSAAALTATLTALAAR